jgi:hypothetical protein
MNIRTAVRRENLALVRGWRRSVFYNGDLAGYVHRSDHDQWIAEFRGRVLGDFATERAAAAAVSDAARGRE